jgi:hypothetical protein
MPYSLRIQQLKEPRNHFHLPIVYKSSKYNISMNIFIMELLIHRHPRILTTRNSEQFGK